MTQRWHPTKSLPGLPGMPAKSARSITRHGPSRGWVSRQAPDGRGLEWLETSLPAETQAALSGLQHSEAEQAPTRRPHSGAATPQAEATADARLEIVLTWQRWNGAEGLPVVKSMHRFSDLYTQGDIPVSETTRACIASFSWNTLQRWRKGLAEGGWTALLPGYTGRAGAGIIDSDAEIRETIEALIFDRPHTNAKYVMRALRQRFDEERLPSYGTLKRWIKTWKESNARKLSAITDPDRHRSTRRPAFGDAAGHVVRLNQEWELDSTPADVICTDGRHAVIGAIDIWSRRAKVLVVPTSKAVAIAALLRRCILDWGVPELARTDEGADYVSRHIKRVFADLGIEHDECPAFSPELKPFVERFFGTMTRGLFEQLPGYAGHNVAQAQEIRNRKAFAARMGETDRETFQVALTSEQLQERCDNWIASIYHVEKHEGLGGRSPLQAAASWTRPVRRIENERALDLLLAEAPSQDGWRLVQKKGIHVDAGVFIAPELGPLVGDRVRIRMDPSDFGTIWVSDSDGAFICKAHDPNRVGIDVREIAAHAVERAKKIDNESRADARAKKARNKPHLIIDEMLAAKSEVVPFPSPSMPYRSDGLSHAEDAIASSTRPPGPRELTDEDRALAAQAREEREARARRVVGKAAPTPVLRPDGAPVHDDIAFYLWVEEHPDLADDADRALCESYLESSTFRRGLERARARRLNRDTA